MFTKHIILIGFKHVGKSVIGRQLAQRLNLAFVDLDVMIEALFSQPPLTCRQMMQIHGQAYFRNIENQTLKEALQFTPSVIALGGGAVMDKENQTQLNDHLVIHVTADQDIVFARIMNQGLPVFFSKDCSPRAAFNQLWAERMPIYQQLAHATIENNHQLEVSVNEIELLVSKMNL